MPLAWEAKRLRKLLFLMCKSDALILVMKSSGFPTIFFAKELNEGILEDIMLPWARESYGHDCLTQQDNSPQAIIHTSEE